jgi:alkaline phosphatase D
LLGSCAHLRADGDSGRPFSEGYHIFDEMAARGGDLMLWLGDNHYYRAADTASPAGMAARWEQVRRHPSLQALLRALPHAAIWDDHDFGPNDSHREFVFKDDSLALFRRHWPQPPGGMPATSGIFQKLSLGDVDLFLLDGRYHRDPLTRAAEGGLYGAVQLGWLKRELLASRAAFKLVAGGTQFFNDINRFEDWRHYPRERAEFLDWLTEARIEGLLFLSGDRHHTELLRHEREGAYPLHELTCSPLTSRIALPRDEQDNPQRRPGTLVVERNWCEISLSGEGPRRRLRVGVFNNEGFELWHRDFSRANLSGPRPAAAVTP